MAVPEQTPYIEHTGNGVTISFSLGFICKKKEHLIVKINDAEVPVNEWSLTGENVIFNIAPGTNEKISLQRKTPNRRTTNYQSFNNSFNPTAINEDLDTVWLRLQEEDVAKFLLNQLINMNYEDLDEKGRNIRQELIEQLATQANQFDQKIQSTANQLNNQIYQQGVTQQQLQSYYSFLLNQMANLSSNKNWLASLIVDASGKNQQQINTFYEGAFQFVDNWGAKGDGVTQDREKINNAITAAHNLYLITGRPVTLKYRDGATYVAHDLLLRVGVNHVCDGHAKILKTPATTGQAESSLNWRTIFTIEGLSLSAVDLSNRVLISGITLDGNYQNMNWTWGTYNQQQGSSLKLYNTSIPVGSRFKIELRNFKTINSVADGVTISQNIDIIGSNIEMQECFRGGLVHTGGNTVAKFDNVVGENANVHIELDGRGHGDTYRSDITYNNVEIDAKNKLAAAWGGFYATPSDGGIINLNNFKCYSKGFYIQGGFGDKNNSESQININDGYFVTSSNTGVSVLFFPPNMTFSNTHLHHVGGGVGLNWYWQTVAGSTSNRKAIFKNGCKFTSDGGVGGTLPESAIKNIFGYNSLNNYFEFYDTTFEGFQFSLDSYSGCQAVFGDGCKLNTTTGVRVGTGANQNVNIKFGKIELGAQCNSFIFGYLTPNAVGNVIEFNGTIIPQEKLAENNTGNFDSVNGLLTITAKSKPNATRNAWNNTVWRVVNAGLGQPYEYKNYSTLPARSANWRAVAWLTASGNTASRPTLGTYDVGTPYINTETNKVETWTGTVWI